MTNPLRFAPLLAWAALAACDTAPAAGPSGTPAAIDPGPAASVELPAAPAQDEDALYAYSPIGRKDPFRPFVTDERLTGGDSPLQQYELEQLKLIAAVTGVASPYAMVEDPEGYGHVVRRGDLIGRHYGRAQTISSRKLIVREERITLQHGKAVELTALEMNDPKEPAALARARRKLALE